MKRSYFFTDKQRIQNREKLNLIANEILNKISGSALASDQFCRQMDLAIDFCEDVAALSSLDVQKIVNIFSDHGATAKVSSIHVNGWFGNYDKLTMCKTFAKEILDMDLSNHEKETVFIGDSPNDEPMFHFFSNSVGVSNVKDYSSQIKNLPKYITPSPQGLGFAELVSHLIK